MSATSDPTGKVEGSCGQNTDDVILDNMKDFYGKKIQSSADFETVTCKVGGPWAKPHVNKVIKLIHKDISERYYGCGLTIPDKLENVSVLDLGSGAGLDCFVLSKLVGQEGHVTGLDMTDEQLNVARKYIDYHTEKFGFKSPNIEFVKGYIEKLSESGIKPNSIDVIISNCVIDLSPDKVSVFTEVFQALKEGGEIFFSDLYADRVLPKDIRTHQVLWGEGMAGALWWEELHNMAERVGLSTPLLVRANPHEITKQEFRDIIGDTQYVAGTYRIFKLPKTRVKACTAIYRGTIPYCADQFMLDHKRTFKTGEEVTVNSEIATILKSSRFADDFTFVPLPEEPSDVKVGRDCPFLLAKKSGKCGAK